MYVRGLTTATEAAGIIAARRATSEAGIGTTAGGATRAQNYFLVMDGCTVLESPFAEYRTVPIEFESDRRKNCAIRYDSVAVVNSY